MDDVGVVVAMVTITVLGKMIYKFSYMSWCHGIYFYVYQFLPRYDKEGGEENFLLNSHTKFAYFKAIQKILNLANFRKCDRHCPQNPHIYIYLNTLNLSVPSHQKLGLALQCHLVLFTNRFCLFSNRCCFDKSSPFRAKQCK